MTITSDTSTLSTTSKHVVERICDNCGVSELVQFRVVYASRHKRNSEFDYCVQCVNKLSRVSRKKGRSLSRDKTNNQIRNLFLLENLKQHGKLHHQLETCSMNLYKRGFIKFNEAQGFYYIDEPSIMERSLGFEDVAIRQKKNICTSRLEVDISSEVIRGVTLRVPMLASNMSTVVDSSFCIRLHNLGALGVLHRAGTEKYLLSEISKTAKVCEWTAFSIGVDKDQLSFLKKAVDCGGNIVFVDVAHGYSDTVLSLGKKIKDTYPKVKLVLGNTTNPSMLEECRGYVDAIKCGIAQGFACETKNTAGCTEKQFSAISKFSAMSKEFKVPIISDGGIREPADFTKSIGAGANSIMAGKIFASCPESAAPIVTQEGKQMKIYAGMASRFVQDSWKGGVKSGTCTEGGVRFLDVGESVDALLERYAGALRSGITYAGGKDIESFQRNVEFIRIT